MLDLFLSLLMAISPGEPGLAVLLEPRMMDVAVTTGAIRRAKLQLNRHQQQQTNTQCFTGRMPFLSPNQQCQSTEGTMLDLTISNLLASAECMLLSYRTVCE